MSALDLAALPARVASTRARRAIEHYLDGQEELEVVWVLLEVERELIATLADADTAIEAGVEES